MMRSSAIFSVFLAFASGCSGVAREARSAPEVSSSVLSRGESIYFGTVYPLGDPTAAPAFVYERLVDGARGAIVSTHVTRDASQHVVLVESAMHDQDYSLADYVLYTNQLGQSGSIHVDGNTVSFHLVDGAEQRECVEHQADPVAVGPTLVGYIVRRLDALRGGAAVPVRIAVLDRLETIGFELEAVAAKPGQTQIRMNPSSLFLRLLIDPVRLTFDTKTSKLLQLEGRVPPKLAENGALRDFDARVEYSYQADAYR